MTPEEREQQRAQSHDSLNEAIEHFGRTAMRIRDERDMLLAALKFIRNMVVEEALITHIEPHGPGECVLCDADAAIAAVEGADHE